MNVIAGIMIGWVGDTWGIRLVAPFAWGAIWCALCWLTSRSEMFKLNEGSAGRRWGFSDAGAFYFVEYGTAVMTSLVVAALVWGVKTLVR